MSTVVAAPVARPQPTAVYRDDGPPARALGRALGPRLPLPAPALIGAGLLPLVVAAVIGDVPLGAAAAVLAWLVLLVGASSGRPHGRMRWTEPPLVRATEYAGLIWIASLEGADAYPAAFGLLAALTFRHYDLVYRLRHRGVLPAGWMSALSAGWEGRLVAAFLLLAAGALPAGYFVAAAVLGVAFLAESVTGWVGHGRVQRPLEYEDEEDEGQ